jgi:hypothetical protein
MALNNMLPEQDDYAAKMKAYEALLDKNMVEKSQAGQDYSNATAFGKAIDTAVAPTIGVGNALLGVMPKNYSRAEEITTAPFKVSEREALNNKDLLERYKALQASHYKDLGLGIQSQKVKRADEALAETKRHNLASEGITRTKETTKPAPASKSVDALNRNFAKTYNDYQIEGGYTTSQVNLEKMKDVVKQLESGAIQTGGMRSQLPTAGKIGAFVNPGITKIQEQLESAIQGTLRPILGAQMAAIEGQRVFERAFNPAMPNDVNIKKIKYEISALEKRAKATKDAAEYYENNNQSLQGYKAEVPEDTGSSLDTSIQPTNTGKSREQMIADIKAKMGSK